MKKRFLTTSALILAALAATSPRALAQSVSTNAVTTTANVQAAANAQQGIGTATTTGQQSNQTNSANQTSGTICEQEMTATFCNTPTAPNTNGYGAIGGGSGATASGASGSGSGAGSASAGSGGSGAGANNTSSIPACGGFPSANELCN
jgi:hypothetical protein